MADIFLKWWFFFPNVLYYSAKNRKNSGLTVEIWTLLESNIFKCAIFFLLLLFMLFCWKSAKFTTNCWNINFLHEWYFLNARFFCVNKQLFHPKSVKFATNSQTGTFHMLIFLNALFFFLCSNLIFHWESANSRNTQLIVEIKVHSS